MNAAYSNFCLKRPLKNIDKTTVSKKNGSLMKVKSIAECCNTFDLHYAIIGLENQFWSTFEWPLKTGFTVYSNALQIYISTEANTMNPDHFLL